MSSIQEHLAFVNSHLPGEGDLVSRLRNWCDCNSGSGHLEGLAAMAGLLRRRVAEISENVELVDTPPARDVHPDTGESTSIALGQSLRARARPDAPIQVLLNGHMDTVYSADSDFQTCARSMDGRRLQGPGAADMKGGLLVMLEALAIFERHPDAERLGWEILITPDEELGSPGGDSLLREAAKHNHIGFIYESSPPGGSLVRGRMGGGNFLLRARGRSVHVGKNFEDGRNAIAAIAEAVLAVQACNDKFPNARFNVGRISGGGALNAVAEHAHARFNIRYSRQEEAGSIMEALETIRAQTAAKHDLELHWHGRFNRPARQANNSTETLYEFIKETGRHLGQDLPCHDTGGGSDGSNLLAHGLPNIDNLGVIGANLHSPDEYMEIDSLQARIRLSALLLIRIAQGDLPDLLHRSLP